MYTNARSAVDSPSLRIRAPEVHLLLSVCLLGCSTGGDSGTADGEESLNGRQLAGSESGNPPLSDADQPGASPCTAATNEAECTRIDDCAWNLCPPTADCAAPAWCARAEPPPSPENNCAAARNEIECLRLLCQWNVCPPNADCQAPAWCAARTKPAPSCERPNEYRLKRRGSEVVIASSYRSCRNDAECTLVSTGCDNCCQRDAIAKALESTYAENFRAACADYMGGECDCMIVPAEAHCVAGACTMVRVGD